MEPINMIFVLVVVLIVAIILAIILWKMTSSVKATRTALLLVCKTIKDSGAIGYVVGTALEALVSTFIWF